MGNENGPRYVHRKASVGKNGYRLRRKQNFVIVTIHIVHHEFGAAIYRAGVIDHDLNRDRSVKSRGMIRRFELREDEIRRLTDYHRPCCLIVRLRRFRNLVVHIHNTSDDMDAGYDGRPLVGELDSIARIGKQSGDPHLVQCNLVDLDTKVHRVVSRASNVFIGKGNG